MNNVVRINITMPALTFSKTKKAAGKRGLSKFLTDAAEERLRQIKVKKAIEEIKKLPPAFPDIKDSVKWVNKMRKEDEKRMKRLGL